MDRVLSSPSKQKALVRLMSSDPSLLSGLDDDLLASITLLSDPPTKRWDRKPSGDNNMTERKNVQLYPEDAAFVEKKTPTLGGIANVKSAALARANTVLLSPSSNATAVAASACSKQDARGVTTSDYGTTRRTCAASVQQDKPAPVVLLDDGMLDLVDGNATAAMRERGFGRGGSAKKKAKRMRRRDKRKNGSSSSGGSTNNSEDESIRFDNTHRQSLSLTNDSASMAYDSDDGIQTARTVSTDARLASRLLLDHHHFVSREQWIPRSARKACYVCMREFNMLRKRHSCRMCGEVICSRCSVFREVNLPVLENKFRICSCCFVAYRKKLEESAHQNQEDEAETTDPASDGSVDQRESASTRDGSRASSQSNVQAPLASVLSSQFEDSPSLSPSDTVSDHSSSRNTINTMSDFSFSSDTLYDMSNFVSGSFSGSRNMEEELEAVLKAKQLEKEVEASLQRIQALEAQIVSQESQQDLLSTEQQLQLREARATIKLLQEQLRMQELNARQAVYNRDSICLSKLRQTELYANEDDESEALKKKLKVLERQLKQAGISVAEVIPYEVAKKKVAEISKRLQEIGSSELVLEDKQAQAAARKEYYILEQQMEKYHMALVMTDEYIEEQRRKEQEWEDANRVANLDAIRLLRSAIPVDISRLSEKDLMELSTPTGARFPAELARRIKRTNALQLLRIDPKTIVKMHPSVIEGYRTTGLTLLERRALHVVMQEPFREWKKQQKDDLAQKKYSWYCKLKEAFVVAATNFQTHCASSDLGDESGHYTVSELHSCELLGLSCPVRAEERVRKLYSGLGFTSDAEFLKEDILKSDPEGAGEKALLEAQAHAREMVANQRQRDLKAHYKTNMRHVAQAVGALEEMDAMFEQVQALDGAFACSSTSTPQDERQQVSQCNSLLNSARELILLLAKRAGICVTGKRDSAKDDKDTRSPVETRESARVIAFLEEIFADVRALLFNDAGLLRENKSVTAAATFKAVQELLDDVREKNLKASAELHEVSSTNAASGGKRVSWLNRAGSETMSERNDQQRTSSDGGSPHPLRTGNSPPRGVSAALPTSALLFDAIKARRKQNGKRASADDSSVKKTEPPAKTAQSSKPFDLMAAIRARKRAQSNTAEEDSAATVSPGVDAANSA
ncbi:hypothetical protein PRNP1_001960 [Phytophthora ramorum]